MITRQAGKPVRLRWFWILPSALDVNCCVSTVPQRDVDCRCPAGLTLYLSRLEPGNRAGQAHHCAPLPAGRRREAGRRRDPAGLELRAAGRFWPGGCGVPRPWLQGSLRQDSGRRLASGGTMALPATGQHLCPCAGIHKPTRARAFGPSPRSLPGADARLTAQFETSRARRIFMLPLTSLSRTCARPSPSVP